MLVMTIGARAFLWQLIGLTKHTAACNERIPRLYTPFLRNAIYRHVDENEILRNTAKKKKKPIGHGLSFHRFYLNYELFKDNNIIAIADVRDK